MEQKKKSVYVLAVLAAIVTIVAFTVFLWWLTLSHTPVQERNYAEGWSISLNGSEFEKAEVLSEYNFTNLQPGDEIVIQNTLPEDLSDYETLTFLEYLSAIEVEVDGEQIYEYGEKYLAADRMVGSGYHFVNLPIDSAGKPIKITYHIAEPDAFTNIFDPTITISSEAYTEYAKRHMLIMFICSFLTLLGIVLTVTGVVALCFNRIFLRLVYIGIFSFLMGIWTMANMRILQIFHVDLTTNTFIEYLMLYLAAIVFFLMIAEMMHGTKEAPWRYYTICGVALLMTLFTIIATLLQVTNLEHFPRVLGYFHLFAGLSLLLVVVCFVTKSGKSEPSEKALYLGVLFLAISLGMDLLRFNIEKYVVHDQTWSTVSVVPIGSMIFVIMLLVSYMLYLYNRLISIAERDWLTERAYSDELTGIYNRAKCNDTFARLDCSNDVYALINMDLNGLKMINDTYGHAQGDLLLQEFSAILQVAFRDVGDVFRMGGDEFLVIVMEPMFKQIEPAIARMESLERRRSTELPFKIDTSYGIAKSTECDSAKTEKVYSVADQRMYDMKVAKKRGRRLR